MIEENELQGEARAAIKQSVQDEVSAQFSRNQIEKELQRMAGYGKY